MNGNIQNHFMLQKQGERGVSGYIQNHLMLKENMRGDWVVLFKITQCYRNKGERGLGE